MKHHKACRRVSFLSLKCVYQIRPLRRIVHTISCKWSVWISLTTDPLCERHNRLNETRYEIQVDRNSMPLNCGLDLICKNITFWCAFCSQGFQANTLDTTWISQKTGKKRDFVGQPEHSIKRLLQLKNIIKKGRCIERWFDFWSTDNMRDMSRYGNCHSLTLPSSSAAQTISQHSLWLYCTLLSLASSQSPFCSLYFAIPLSLSLSPDSVSVL